MRTITKVIIAGLLVGYLATRRSSGFSSFTGGSDKAIDKLSDATIRQIDERVRRDFAAALRPAMIDGDIVTGPRMAAFLAQILHETGGFQFMYELASGDAYEGRTDLGNTQPGDGRRYKGRGFIQLTGRINYRQAGNDLGLDLENNPDLAARADIAAKTAVWFWSKKRLNARADNGDITGITRAINGGLHGLAERKRLYENAIIALGVGAGGDGVAPV